MAIIHYLNKISMNLNKKLHNKYKTCSNYNSHILKFGVYGFKACKSSVLTETNIDLLQRSISGFLKKISKGSKTTKYWNRLQVNSTTTSLSPESRMGKGKGAILHKILYVKQGQIIFEFSSISLPQISMILSFINSKLPFSVKLLKRII
uniref:Ribosomal protein L16 n=1 Tax=Palmaria palmata TaxID=2822 RepID=A0A0A7A726_PALPL|nr:ribosomal protein L16 [Palmaria palmata]AHB62148.1 ribosomal protein L16 [Palmaria palmata]